MMSRPRFSVVIPTRDRTHTLRHTLRTCLAQAYDDVEFLVSDNGSTTNAQPLVEELADPRLRYVRTPRPLAMSESWEFAVSQAKGEFITVIGDDDGLLLHALPEVDRLLRTLNAKVLRWESACYYWPCLPAQPYAQANRLLIPLKQAESFYRIRRYDSSARIAAVGRWELSYSELPMIYCSIVHRDLLEALRTKMGRVFGARCPDVYSAVAIAHTAGAYFSVDAPMGISGLSGTSNGVACHFLECKSKVADDFARLNEQAALRRDPRIPALSAMSAYVADSYLQARVACAPHDRGELLDRRKMLAACVRELRIESDAQWQQALTVLRASATDDAKLTRWFDTEFGRLPWTAVQKQQQQAQHIWRRYGGHYMFLDTARFGVTNIYDAAELCENLLGNKADGSNCHLVAA